MPFISAYCERTDPGFWAEPLNALTNAAFILAALLAFAQWRRRSPDWAAAFLIALVFAIGIGSFAFHTLPSRATEFADVAPIELFAFGFFALAMVRIVGLGWPAAAAATMVFLAASLAITWAVAPWLPAAARGSAGYVSFVIALLAVAAIAARRDPPNAIRLLAAGVIFGVSLTLRSIDHAVCAAWPTGTHFMWHLLNAAVLYILLRTALSSREAAKSSS